MSEVPQHVWVQLQCSDSRLEAALLITMLCALKARWSDGDCSFLGVLEADKGTGRGRKAGKCSLWCGCSDI